MPHLNEIAAISDSSDTVVLFCQGMVSSEDLIKYAHRISSSNAVEAPVSWMPGLLACLLKSLVI